MPRRRITPSYIAAHIRRVLKDGGSAPHALEVQRFFKEQVQSRGWRTAELRKLAFRFRRTLIREQGLGFLVQVGDKLFSGAVTDEKNFAVFLLERVTGELGDDDFELFVSWLDRVKNWSDHDALVHYLIAPMMVSKPARVTEVFRWVKSKNRWRRRAACVALIRGARQKMFFPEIVKIAEMLLRDDDDMVQKGLGWMLREAAKVDGARTVRYLVKIREKAPRLVLRTACETLGPKERERVLGSSVVARRRVVSA